MRALMLTAVMLLWSGSALAAELDLGECPFPEAPVVPDGNAASEEEMGNAGSAVRAYVADMQSALQCLAVVEESLGEGITEEQQDTLINTYNGGVDEMNDVATRYNEAVRAYKAR